MPVSPVSPVSPAGEEQRNGEEQRSSRVNAARCSCMRPAANHGILRASGPAGMKTSSGAFPFPQRLTMHRRDWPIITIGATEKRRVNFSVQQKSCSNTVGVEQNTSVKIPSPLCVRGTDGVQDTWRCRTRRGRLVPTRLPGTACHVPGERSFLIMQTPRGRSNHPLCLCAFTPSRLHAFIHTSLDGYWPQRT